MASPAKPVAVAATAVPPTVAKPSTAALPPEMVNATRSPVIPLTKTLPSVTWADLRALVYVHCTDAPAPGMINALPARGIGVMPDIQASELV